MNDLAELVNKGSDGGKCISYTPFDPQKDDGARIVERTSNGQYVFTFSHGVIVG